MAVNDFHPQQPPGSGFHFPPTAKRTQSLRTQGSLAGGKCVAVRAHAGHLRPAVERLLSDCKLLIWWKSRGAAVTAPFDVAITT